MSSSPHVWMSFLGTNDLGHVRCHLKSGLREDILIKVSWEANRVTVWTHLESWHPTLSGFAKNEKLSNHLPVIVELYKQNPSSLKNHRTLQDFGFVRVRVSNEIISKINLALWFITEHLPYASADHSLLTGWFRRQGIPSKSRLTAWQIANRYLPALESATDFSLTQRLKECNGLSLTYDTWTEDSSKKYLIVSCHFISQEWKAERDL